MFFRSSSVHDSKSTLILLLFTFVQLGKPTFHDQVAVYKSPNLDTEEVGVIHPHVRIESISTAQEIVSNDDNYETVLQRNLVEGTTLSNIDNVIDVDHIRRIGGTAKEPCSSATTCENCTALSKWYVGCHWCSHDQACHAYGSYYGCTHGSSCGSQPPATISSSPTSSPTFDDSICYEQKTCIDCSSFSTSCHWCAKDYSCHAKGSLFGCSTGVRCYNNSQCHRTNPQPLSPQQIDDGKANGRTHQQSTIVTVVLCSMFGVAGLFIFLGTIYIGLQKNIQREQLNPASPSSTTASVSDENELINSTSVCPLDDSNDLVVPLLDHTSGQTDTIPTNACASVVVTATSVEDGDSLLSDHPTETAQTGVPNSGTQSDNQTSRSRRLRHRCTCDFSSIRSIYNACIFCYLLAFAGVTISIAAILYYPQPPVYNICNEEVAWRSIINSMLTLNKTVNYEILASISNPNYMNMVLEKGHGAFVHNETVVGRFEIRPTLLIDHSITDVLLIANFTIDKWKSLGLFDEFYQGNLALKVNASTKARFPTLYNYTQNKLRFKKVLVTMNDQSDRILCSCRTWNSTNIINQTTIHGNQKQSSQPIQAQNSPSFLAATK